MGVLQPVFANGASVVTTGIANLNGLAFSNLDFNLWHTTAQRGGDAGHGMVATPDGFRGTTGVGDSCILDLIVLLPIHLPRSQVRRIHVASSVRCWPSS